MHAEIMDSLVDDAEKVVDRVAAPFCRDGFRADTVATDGAAHRRIVAECEEGGP